MNGFIFYMILQGFININNAQSGNFKQLSSSEFKKLLDEKGTLLDVRTRGEFANGHIPRAGQLNYYSLDFRQKLLLTPKDEPVYLYCNTGYRSRKAAEILAENGYTNVYNLQHGIMEWELINLPVVTEPDARPDQENKMEPDEFAALLESESLVFIDFYAPWCGPCRQMMPMIDSLTVEYREKIKIVKINADASKKLIREQQLIGVPYLVLYKDGEKVFSHTGLIEREELTRVFKVSR